MLYDTISHDTRLYYIISYHIILYYIILYYTILYYTISDRRPHGRAQHVGALEVQVQDALRVQVPPRGLCMYLSLSIYIYIYTYVGVCMYVYIYIYICHCLYVYVLSIIRGYGLSILRIRESITLFLECLLYCVWLFSDSSNRGMSE